MGVSVGAGVNVGLGVGVKVPVKVGTAVEEGDGVYVSVGATVGVSVSTNASTVGVDVVTPDGSSSQPTTPGNRHKTRKIARCRRLKMPPAAVMRAINSYEFKLIRLNCVTGHRRKPSPFSATVSKAGWAG